MVRVIAGEARGRKLKTLDSESTKPTLDRVKEAMFSILTPYVIGAKVLDLFAGNGALGLEALSRGAKSCDFNDFSGDCCKIIRENAKIVSCENRAAVTQREFTEFIARSACDYDLILLDPPYGKGFAEEALRLISAKLPEDSDAVAMCEHSADDGMPETIGKFTKIKDKRYGTVALTLYKI